MKLDTAAAWNEASAMVSANREVLVILAGAFFLLPGLALELFLPKPPETPAENLDAALEVLRTFWAMAAPWFLASILIQTLGQLTITRLVGGQGRATVGEALREGLAGLPVLILVQLLLGLGWALIGGIMVGAPAAAGSIGLAVLFGLILLGVALWIGARLSLILPLIAIERQRNPLTILGRSWQLTKGNAGAILLFLVLVVVVAVVLAVVASAVGGTVATLLIGEHGGAITAGVLSSLLSALVTLYVTAMLTAIYRHLGGQADPQMPDVFR
ncbi:MAG TPA: glycerophosphoryl diester phosphodiesterase membrane domain-containing protein [Novosphingobium sp.]|jgi:hypothetical protein|nr:glycerophosphoryl diester phosphodiesterase membrane domain-containing protein [Novosphingobium sp.]